MFALVGMVLGICAACLWPTDAEKLEVPRISIDPQALLDSTSLAAAGDNFTWQNHPNQNNGTQAEMRTGVGSTGRAFVRWTQVIIDSIVGSGMLVSARLDITINSSSGWSGSGGQLSIHRVTKDWTELGSTANCAIDTNTGNDQADCSGATAWVLNNPAVAPWKSAATDSLGVTNGQTGTISFNVTADLQAFLDDTANYGWVIKPRNDAATGDVRLRSREAASNQPVLVITVDADTSPPPVPDGFIAPDSAVAPLVNPPAADPRVLILRDVVHIKFDDTASGPSIRDVFARYGAQVVGGYPLTATYLIRVPDPGPTYDALESLMQQLRAEPGVRYVYWYVFQEPEESLGRYPDDGPDGQRSNWLVDTTDATRALLAIRMPLAWGCETGRYSSTYPGIAVMDNLFAIDPDEFPAPAPEVRQLPASEPLETASASAGQKSHGTSVLGMLSARGDNGTGVAGVTWRSKLFLYELASESGGVARLAKNRASYIINVVLPGATTDPVRILHSSVNATANWDQSEALADAIRAFAGASPEGRLFVQAAGNNRVTIRSDTANLIKDGSGAWLVQQAMSRLIGDPTVADKMILVAGANDSGTAIWDEGEGPFGQGATLWTGMTDIMAPAEDILVMVRQQDYGMTTRPTNGSSIAAPMVSGVAALLMTFDPEMTASEVKSHIINGSKERRAAWDSVITVPTIYNQGSFALNLLDAYGALSRAAKLASGTPICDFPVYTRDGQLFYERVPGTPVAQPIASGQDLSRVTVAQGGRVLAASSDLGWIRFDHLGQSVTPIPDVLQRVYLETDTADLLMPVGPDFFIRQVRVRRLGGSDVMIDLWNVLQPTATYFEAVEIQPSPVGDWIGVNSFANLPGGPPFTSVSQWSIVPVGGGTPTSVLQIFSTAEAEGVGEVAARRGRSWNVTGVQATACGPDCYLSLIDPGSMAWSQDNARLQFALPKGAFDEQSVTVSRTVMRSVTFPGGAPTGHQSDIGPIEGRELVWPRFTANGELLLNERDVASGSCTRTWRGPTIGQLLDDDPTAVADCDRGQDPRRRFNTPPVASLRSLPPALRSLLQQPVGPRPPLRRGRREQ